MDSISAKIADNFEDMKKSIVKAGSLFCQYRPCRRAAATIYDIENIRHGVVYAQTPLNMNDPFDSMVGFSVEKFYNDCISMLLDAIKVDGNLKAIISTLVKHQAFDKIAELMQVLKELKQYINSKRISLHQTHISFEQFVLSNSSKLYSKLPRKLKEKLDLNAFVGFAILIAKLGSVEITEENIVSVLGMNEQLEALHKKIEFIRDNIYIPEIKKFLSQLTVSCFSTSGWDNQLMWSHYANSYAGICIEYDFSKINKFIGFIYPINYTTERPTISLRDIGVKEFNLDGPEKILHEEVDIKVIISYLLAKNVCWSYEKEWRIINIGETNTPIFIDLPFIKSITFGMNVDPLCRHLLLDVCKEKRIDCFDIALKTDEFVVERTPIYLDSITYNLDDELKYFELLVEQSTDLSNKIEKTNETINRSVKEGNIDGVSAVNQIGQLIDMLINAYFLKASFNRMCNSSNEKLTKDDIPSGFFDMVSGIESLIRECSKAKELKSGMLSLKIAKKVDNDTYMKALRQIDDMIELVEKIKSIPWHTAVGLCDE